MEYIKDRLISVLDKYHVTATIPLPKLVDEILDKTAAPELYEALRYLLDFLAMPTDEWVKQYGAGVRDAVEDAIRKIDEQK